MQKEHFNCAGRSLVFDEGGFRKMITIMVRKGSCEEKIEAEEGNLLLSVLQKHGLAVEAPCGGNGICGGCKVKTQEGEIRACVYRLQHDIRVELPSQEQFQSVLMKETAVKKTKKQKEGFGVAIDIGTTTLGFALKNLTTGEKVGQYGCVNSQGQYGADVASRIMACKSEEGLERLTLCIQNDIQKGISGLLSQYRIGKEEIRQIVIAGNAVMLHILQGVSPEPMGKAPFYVPQMELKRFVKDQMEIILFPHAGAFVGGDIMAGIQYLKIGESDKIKFLLDLGTNGEMVLGNKKRLIASAAAAGPAFENCFRSVGMSGSKILDLLVLNARRKVIGADGLLKQPYREKGIPCGNGCRITQSQIREIQLAKGAIRAGMELLMTEYDCQIEDIEQVYIAGGFGFYLNFNSAIYIGLLPEKFQEKAVTVGNTSLSGAFEALGDETFIENIQKNAKKVQCLNLAELQGFQEKFLEEIAYIKK